MEVDKQTTQLVIPTGHISPPRSSISITKSIEERPLGEAISKDVVFNMNWAMKKALVV